MKQYSNKEDAPLAFHKFFWYVSLPLGFLILIIRMISNFSDVSYFSWFYIVELIFCLAALTLMLVCFIGFFNWKAYAWYSVISYLVINAVYSLLAVIIYAIYMPNLIAVVIGQAIASLTYAILVGIYYKKRRPLFFSHALKMNPESESTESRSFDNEESLDINASLQIKYCYKCGYELREGSAFCGHCGTTVIY